jgi:hypothetical protein
VKKEKNELIKIYTHAATIQQSRFSRVFLRAQLVGEKK